MIAVVLALLALVFGAGVHGDTAADERQLERRIVETVNRPDRIVDFGVVMHVVEHDPNGVELVPGAPPMRIVRTHYAGGMLDTEERRLVGPSQDPAIWFCSVEQEQVILHADTLPLGLLVYGSEGGGKSMCAAMWGFWRVLEHLGEGREGGQVAPTRPRLKFVRDAMFDLYPARWYRYAAADDCFHFVDGSAIQFRAAKKQSGEGGSPLQGFSWSWICGDEMQDMPHAHNELEARGRAGKFGRCKQLRTATAAPRSSWRSLRDKLVGMVGHWVRITLLGPRSPFVWAKFWEDKKRTMDAREYERRVLAMDVGVELAVYYSYDRAQNVARRPALAVDVTAAVLASYQSYTRPGARLAMIVGHDPGNIYNTSVILKLLLVDGNPVWFVVGELQTKQTTPQAHARALKQLLRSRFGMEDGPDSDKVAIFCDPHGKGESQTDYQTVYGAFQREGLDVFNPAPMSGRVKRTARVGMLNRLFRDAAGIVRLIVQLGDDGEPVAPILVDSLESLEKREGEDDPEGHQRKDATDKTHAPAATGYALWALEQEAVTADTQQVARRSITRRAAA